MTYQGKSIYTMDTSGLYYKNITILNDAYRVIMSDATNWSINYDNN